MAKKDISMITLVFFLTRCFFNLYTFTNIFSYLFISLSIFIIILLLKKIKLNIFNYIFLKWIYFFCLLFIFVNILINATNFININYFRYENYFSTTISLLVISYIIGKDEIKTISSISEVFFFIFIIITIMISIGLISLIRVNNYQGFIKINNFSLNFLPFMIIFVLYYIRKNNIITGYLLGTSSAFLDIMLLVGSLGIKLPLTYSYPGISILKTITFLHFINHLDKLFSFIYLFEYNITLALIFNIMKKILKKESLTLSTSSN